MTTPTLSITIDWDRIENLVTACDRTAYAAGHRECWGGGASQTRGRTTYDLIRIVEATTAGIHWAWSLIHGDALHYEEGMMEADATAPAWYVERGGNRVLCRSRRGARWAATRNGGRAVRVGIPSIGMRACRIAAAIQRMRCALAYVLALSALREELRTMGLCYAHAANGQELCSATGERIAVTGLGWWAGARSETRGPRVSDVRAFVAGEMSAEAFRGACRDAATGADRIAVAS